MLMGRNEPQMGCPGEKAAGAYACNYGAGKAPSTHLSPSFLQSPLFRGRVCSASESPMHCGA